MTLTDKRGIINVEFCQIIEQNDKKRQNSTIPFTGRKTMEKLEIIEVRSKKDRKEFLEYTVCLGLNMFITSADWSKKAKFYARHRLYCKQIAQNQDEYMTIIHTPSYIHFMDVFKLPWFVFFLKYYYTEFKQYLKKRKSRIKHATR